MWLAAFTASGLAWAWLTVGTVPIGILAAMLLWGASRSARAERRPGLPQPLDGHRAAAYLVAVLLMAVLVGYRSDWLVFGGLGVALVAKLGAVVRPGAPRP